MMARINFFARWALMLIRLLHSNSRAYSPVHSKNTSNSPGRWYATLPGYWSRFLSPPCGNNPCNQDLDNDVCHKNGENFADL